jgi:hypothetical protein
VTNRSRGSFAIACATTPSNTANSGDTSDGTGTGSLICANSVPACESRGYGTCPVSVTYNRQPSA